MTTRPKILARTSHAPSHHFEKTSKRCPSGRCCRPGGSTDGIVFLLFVLSSLLVIFYHSYPLSLFALFRFFFQSVKKRRDPKGRSGGHNPSERETRGLMCTEGPAWLLVGPAIHQEGEGREKENVYSPRPALFFSLSQRHTKDGRRAIWIVQFSPPSSLSFFSAGRMNGRI